MRTFLVALVIAAYLAGHHYNPTHKALATPAESAVVTSDTGLTCRPLGNGPTACTPTAHCVSGYEGKPGEDPTVVTCDPRKVDYINRCVTNALADQVPASDAEIRQTCARESARYATA